MVDFLTSEELKSTGAAGSQPSSGIHFPSSAEINKPSEPADDISRWQLMNKGIADNPLFQFANKWLLEKTRIGPAADFLVEKATSPFPRLQKALLSTGPEVLSGISQEEIEKMPWHKKGVYYGGYAMGALPAYAVGAEIAAPVSEALFGMELSAPIAGTYAQKLLPYLPRFGRAVTQSGLTWSIGGALNESVREGATVGSVLERGFEDGELGIAMLASGGAAKLWQPFTGRLIKNAMPFAAEVGTLTAYPHLKEGKIPPVDDLLEEGLMNAMFLGGLHAVTASRSISAKLIRNKYVTEGQKYAGTGETKLDPDVPDELVDWGKKYPGIGKPKSMRMTPIDLPSEPVMDLGRILARATPESRARIMGEKAAIKEITGKTDVWQPEMAQVIRPGEPTPRPDATLTPERPLQEIARI